MFIKITCINEHPQNDYSDEGFNDVIPRVGELVRLYDKRSGYSIITEVESVMYDYNKNTVYVDTHRVNASGYK